MKNIPELKLGIVAVSRDCFPIELSKKRRKSVVEECKKADLKISEIETIVENESDALKALSELE
nr:fucose isomerase [Spirochaetota bacterium]